MKKIFFTNFLPQAQPLCLVNSLQIYFLFLKDIKISGPGHFFEKSFIFMGLFHIGTEIEFCFSPVDLSCVNLITRLVKELRREEGKLLPSRTCVPRVYMRDTRGKKFPEVA